MRSSGEEAYASHCRFHRHIHCGGRLLRRSADSDRSARSAAGRRPFVFDTAEQYKIRVSVLARGLSHPWSIAFLPDGSMLITERPGRLRIFRDGKLDATEVSGVSEGLRSAACGVDGCGAPSEVRRE